MSDYRRKTIDSYELHVNYGGGFEHETTNWTFYHAREERRTYSVNCPEYATKIVKRRVQRSSLNENELAEAAKQVAEARAIRLAARPTHLATP